MRNAYLAMLSPGMVRVAITAVAISIGAFAIIGPVGTYMTLTLLERLMYCVCVVFCWPICYSVSVVTAYLTRFRSAFQMGLIVAVVSLGVAVPSAATVYAFQALFFPEHAPQIKFVTLYSFVATATVVCHVLFHYLLCQRVRLDAVSGGQATGDEAAVQRGPHKNRRIRSLNPALDQSCVRSPDAASTSDPQVPVRSLNASESTAHDDAPTAEPATPIIDQLPGEVGKDLVFLKSEGRYVHVFTTAGSRRVTARFADMVAALGDFGVQVHRSYWVAFPHASELVKRDSQTLLRLPSGDEIPVSRTYLVAARAALGNRQGQ